MIVDLLAYTASACGRDDQWLLSPLTERANGFQWFIDITNDLCNIITGSDHRVAVVVVWWSNLLSESKLLFRKSWLLELIPIRSDWIWTRSDSRPALLLILTWSSFVVGEFAFVVVVVVVIQNHYCWTSKNTHIRANKQLSLAWFAAICLDCKLNLLDLAT